MLCMNCKVGMNKDKSDYLYEESGLDNIYLVIDVYKCPQCKETYPILPDIKILHRLIAKELVKQESFLLGKELSFLRKELGLRVEDLAKISGISSEQIKHWERGEEKIHPSFDRFIRLYFENKDILIGCRKIIKTVEPEREIKRMINEICNYALEAEKVLTQIEHERKYKITILSPAYI